MWERIESDFAASGADGIEIINPYADSPIYNTNLFVSQYCAAKDADFKSISISDMADIKSVSQNTNHGLNEQND